MNITIDEKIWCSNELGVLDKMIIAESIRTELKEVNDELYGHMLLFTRCNPDNVTRSINKLLDLKLLTGNKLYERKKTTNTKESKATVETNQEEKSKFLDEFLKKYKEVIKTKYFEIAKTDSIVLADDAMKLTISCFKNNYKKYETYSTISDNNLLAIFEIAVKLKKKEVGYDHIDNPFAYVTNSINKCIGTC